MDETVCFCVFLSLAGQYTVDLSDDCGQLSQPEHRGHNPMIMTNLKKKKPANSPLPFGILISVCVGVCVDLV